MRPAVAVCLGFPLAVSPAAAASIGPISPRRQDADTIPTMTRPQALDADFGVSFLTGRSSAAAAVASRRGRRCVTTTFAEGQGKQYGRRQTPSKLRKVRVSGPRFQLRWKAETFSCFTCHTAAEWKVTVNYIHKYFTSLTIFCPNSSVGRALDRPRWADR